MPLKVFRHLICRILEDFVFQTFLMMHRRLDETRVLLRPERYHELRYEDLVTDPLGQLEQIYQRLELGDFDATRADVEHYLSGVREYRTNRYQVHASLRDEITERWGQQIQRQGYKLKPKAAHTVSAEDCGTAVENL